MEQIAKLLFATTVLTLFSYVVFFLGTTYRGYGGEYWGLDSSLRPHTAVDNAIERRDYRFLEVRLRDAYGEWTITAPAYQECFNRPFGDKNGLRTSSSEPLHGQDSIRISTTFAKQYNEALNWELGEEMNWQCQVWTETD